MNYGNEMEHFSLRWNNFNDNMKSGFHDLLRTEDFVDVTIAAEGKLIQAHKMVLSVCSPYFKNIFKTNPCQHPVIFLKDVTHKELSGILQFMYLGEVSIQQEELGRFLKTAEALQIKGLTDDYSDVKDETEEEIVEEKHRNHHRNNTILVDMDLSEREPSAKKLKLSSVNEVVKSSGRSSPIDKELEIEIDNHYNSTIASKNGSSELELSDVESDKMSLKDESVSVSESFLELSDNISDVRNDAPTNNHNSSDFVSPKKSLTTVKLSGDWFRVKGQPQDGLTGVQGFSNEPFVMTDGNKGLKYCPMLTKNQGLCTICGRILQHKKNLQTHIADQHSGIFRSWSCQICKKVCKTWSALRVHTNRHHMKLGPSPLVHVANHLN